jgi:hypothetical protein
MSRTADIGLILVERESKIIIDELRAGGPAALGGTVQPGDMILAVNGCPVRGSNLCLTLIIGDAGTPVELRCKRGRKEYEVTIFREKQLSLTKAEPGQMATQNEAVISHRPNKPDSTNSVQELSMTMFKSDFPVLAVRPTVPDGHSFLQPPIAQAESNPPKAVPAHDSKGTPHLALIWPQVKEVLQELQPLNAALSTIYRDLATCFSSHLHSASAETKAARGELAAHRAYCRPALLLAMSDLDAGRPAVQDLAVSIAAESDGGGSSDGGSAGDRFARRCLRRLRAVEEELQRQALCPPGPPAPVELGGTQNPGRNTCIHSNSAPIVAFA